ncbi:MAG: (2Fe-2S) ferredoxin domain-containing protein [Magnetospirillum sp.]|nr:(2Fe-2S) ferredoxin domain-containing protein [Magnetospirillum sp.]
MSRELYVCRHLRWHMDASCANGGADLLVEALHRELAARGLDWAVIDSVCLGYCAMGPNIKARGGPLLHHCKASKAADIVDRLLRDWAPDDTLENEPAASP